MEKKLSEIQQQLRIVSTSKKGKPQYEQLPKWFKKLVHFGKNLEILSRNSSNKLFGCLILPESIYSPLAIAMGICISFRLNRLKQLDDKPDTNDCVIVDGRNAICVGTDVIADQTFYRFQFRKEKASRRQGEPSTLIPETSLKNRVIQVASSSQEEWVGFRNKTSKLNTSPLEKELFGHDCRSGVYNSSPSPILGLSGIVSHFDDADTEMRFTVQNHIATGSLYDFILPKHKVSPAVTPVSFITSRDHERSSAERIHIACNPLSIDSIMANNSVINLVVLTAGHHNSLAFGQEFLAEYQGAEYEAVSLNQVGSLMDGIPASFFGAL
ncbi:hypothetical protein, partial [Endozoicomonas sp.]|uniref:hypothetical protein n=1 Tax=Endozoicomonas sp. TaxID=1892382 RepID=UPI00383B2683